MPKKSLAEEAYAVYYYGDSLIFYYDNLKNSRKGNISKVFEVKEAFNGYPGWCTFYDDDIKYAKFDSSFVNFKPTSTEKWFKGCTSLADIYGLHYLNTSYVHSMYEMFAYCSKLKTLDLSYMDTHNVTDMRDMFYGCLSLTTIYVSELWNMNNVSSSKSMFTSCDALVGGMGTKHSRSHNNGDYAHVDGGAANPGYFTYKKIEEDVPEDIEEIIPSNGGNGQASGAYTVLNNGTLTFYYDNNRSSKTGTVYDIYTSYTGYPDWAKDSLIITKAVFDASFTIFKPTSTSYWFSCCPKMTEIEGLGKLDTRYVTDMRYMFHNCRSLKKLDTGDFLTSQVKDMSNMFSGCHELSSVDVTCFNTANVTTMEAMFKDCRSLTEIDVTGFETKNISTMAHMFRGCSSMSEINLKNMSIASLTNTYAMFYGCEALTTIYSNTDWSVGSITSSDYMFGQCLKLKGGNGTLFNASNTDKAYALPDGSNSRPGYFTMRNGGGTPGGNVGTNGAPVYAVLNNGTLTFYCDNLWSSRQGTRYDIDDLNYSYSDQLRSYRTMPEWIEDRKFIKRAVFDPSFANYKPKSTVCWFYSCQNLTAIEGMEYLNTSEVTNMSAMFRFCYALTDVDVSHMDTRNVTDMSFVFCYCESLTNIDVSAFNTAKVTNMEHMFHTCPIETLDLRNFETTEVTNMNTMFDWCKNLKTIYAKRDKWNTDNVTFSLWMFSGCNSLVGGQGTKFDSNHTDKEYAVIDGGFCAPGYLTGDADDLPREAYAVYKDSVLTFYYDTNINCREGEIYTTDKFRPYFLGWSGVKRSINTVVFDTSFKDYDQLTTTRTWFQSCGTLEQFVGMENLVTTNVTDMARTFHGCGKLMTLDVSSLDTRNVKDMSFMFAESGMLDINLQNFSTESATSMYAMFYACPNLVSIDVSGFETKNVKDMQAMFRKCGNLSSLDVSHFNTTNVTNMSGMFSVTKLSSVDVSHFNTKNVVNMSLMFERCKELTTIDVSNFDTQNVDDMSEMFSQCIGLTSIDVSGFNTSNVTDMKLMFYNCRSLTNLDVSGFKTDNVTDMSGMFHGCSSLTGLDVSCFKTDKVTYMGSMFQNCSGLTSLDVSGFKTDNVTDMSRMFSSCSGLTSLDVSGFKTDNVTDMKYMFSGCSGLTSIDVSGFKTDNVKYMSGMFSACSGLTSLDVSGFKTENVTDMSGMFSGCSGQTSLNVSGFKTDNVTNMDGMFYGCSSLTSLNVSGWNNSNVMDMSYMFYGCSGLTSLDVSGFKTDNVTDMDYMFYGCSGLTSLNVSGWNNSNVMDMSYMFSGCSGLTSLDMSGFKTDNVTDMDYMFYGCSGLTSLDVSGFKTDNVKYMYYMFSGCSALTTIYASDGWSTEKVSDGSNMFKNCSSLVGGKGTAYDESHTDYTYAHIDGGVDAPGYFTYKAVKTNGDVNGDCTVDVADIASIISVMANQGNESLKKAADVNGDGTVDVADIATVITEMAARARLQQTVIEEE